MIRNIIILFNIIIFFIFLSGCEEKVVNNNNNNQTINFDNATIVNIGTSVLGYIANKGQYNVYKFATKRGGVVSAVVDSVPSNIDINIDMYDASKNWIYGNYGAAGQATTLNAARPPSTYYIVVKDGYNDASSEQPYRFIVNLDSSDIYEYNNTLATARTIGLNNEIQAKIKPEDDEDAFQFFSPRDGIIQFTISNVPSNIDMVSDVYDYQNNYLGGITGATGQSYTFGTLAFSGTYYIKLKDGYKNAFSENFYRIRINIDSSDYWEINNTFPYAKSIAVNQNVAGKIKPVGDVDMFKVNITTAGSIQIPVNPVPQEVTMVVELFDNSQNRVANAIGLSNGQAVTLYYVVSTPGNYYVKLSDEYNNDSSEEYYNFRVVK